MNQIEFRFEKTLITKEQQDQLADQLNTEIQKMKDALKRGYNNDRASLNLPVDDQALRALLALVDEKKKLEPSYIIVVGIGGSNLGTLAVVDAILGKKYNLKSNYRKLLFADTVDSDLLSDIIEILEPALKKKQSVLINVVSKSGSTTETIANFEVFLQLLYKYVKNPNESIVVTTDYNSKLWHLAKEKGFALLEIPKKVGGRYSVFSSVGLFPLAMMGIDIKALLDGAKHMRSRCLAKIHQNPAAKSAACAYLHFKNNKNIHDLFLFSDDLESIGKWNRQLIAESVGKEYDLSGNQVFTGITPTYSIGSTDLHSVAQLYLGGPFDKFTTFVQIEENKQKVFVPCFEEYAELVKGIQDRSIQHIMNAIYQGIKTAFEKGNRPFMEIKLLDKSEASIGQLLQFKMMETMILGGLFGINPFDQPNVEMYKKETREILEEYNL